MIQMFADQASIDVVQDLSSPSPLPLLDPLICSLSLNRTLFSSHCLDVRLNIDYGCVKLRISVSDLMLFRSILLRATLVPQLDPIDKPSSPSSSPPPPPAISSSEAPMTQYEVRIGAESIGVELLNDWMGETTPLFRLSASALSVSLGGPMGGLHGSLSLALTALFFNPFNCHWEPLVEEWKPSIEVAQPPPHPQSFSVSVTSHHPLSLNLTSSFQPLGSFSGLNRMYGAYTIKIGTHPDPWGGMGSRSTGPDQSEEGWFI